MDLKKILKNKRNLLVGGVAIATLITLTGCGRKDNQTKTYSKENDVAVQNVATNTNENTTSVNQTDSNVSKELIKDSSKELVYALVDDSKTWMEPSPNGNFELGYSYKIPQINIDSEDANNINKEIQDEYYKYYKDQKEYIDSNGYVGGCSRIEYAYHINGDIVSIVMASFWDGGSVERSAYNISTKTGKEVTNSELLNKKGLNEADFPSKLSGILTEQLKEMYTPSEEQLSYTGSAEFYNTQYKRTTSLENCSVNNDMYLNTNNQLCVITTRYNIAGGDGTEIIVNMDTNSIYVQE